MKILYVEDDEKLRRGVAQGLTARGYTVDTAQDGTEGEKYARMGEYDLFIFDIMMPGQDGVILCQTLRVAGIMTPVLFLTARDAVADTVLALDSGGDDYLVKPFSFDELTARIRALARRAPQSVGDILVLDELHMDTRAQDVTAGGKKINLTLREYGLLEYLMRNQGVVVTREDILSHVWDRFFDSLSNVVDVHLKNIRKKLPKSYARRIQTVWGKGYRLV